VNSNCSGFRCGFWSFSKKAKEKKKAEEEEKEKKKDLEEEERKRRKLATDISDKVMGLFRLCHILLPPLPLPTSRSGYPFFLLKTSVYL
jgi:hypothetical protein